MRWSPLGSRLKLVEPGVINTDFVGSSFDFSNDETLEEYQELVGKFHALRGMSAGFASDPHLVSEVIYRAATDGTSQLRYIAGDDAEQMIATSKVSRRRDHHDRHQAAIRPWLGVRRGNASPSLLAAQRAHGDVIENRTVSFLELFYDQVYVVVMARQSEHPLNVAPTLRKSHSSPNQATSALQPVPTHTKRPDSRPCSTQSLLIATREFEVLD